MLAGFFLGRKSSQLHSTEMPKNRVFGLSNRVFGLLNRVFLLLNRVFELLVQIVDNFGCNFVFLSEFWNNFIFSYLLRATFA